MRPFYAFGVGSAGASPGGGYWGGRASINNPTGARRKRGGLPKLIFDPGGRFARNAVKVPIDKPHKKIKKSNPHIEGTPKKAKLLSFAMSATKITKVHLVLYFSWCMSIGFSSELVTTLYYLWLIFPSFFLHRSSRKRRRQLLYPWIWRSPTSLSKTRRRIPLERRRRPSLAFVRNNLLPTL